MKRARLATTLRAAGLLLFLAPAARGQMSFVPEGPFRMGSADGNPDEGPGHTVSLPAFRIDRLEVSNAAFLDFVRKSGKGEALEGPWFRHSAEGSVALISRYEKRYNTSLCISHKSAPPAGTAPPPGGGAPGQGGRRGGSASAFLGWGARRPRPSRACSIRRPATT